MTPNDAWKEVTGEAVNPNLITPEKYQELVDAHVMFKVMAADPYLASAGIASDWPCGRGCYQSSDGGFIIWFGEEDQLRIISMQSGGDVRAVFDRLARGIKAVGDRRADRVLGNIAPGPMIDGWTVAGERSPSACHHVGGLPGPTDDLANTAHCLRV